MLANVGVERAVLAALCKYGKDALIEIEDVGVIDLSFTSVANQALFTSAKHLLDNKDYIDQGMLLISLKDLGYLSLFESKKDIEFIAALFDFPILQDNVRGFATRLERLAIARKAIAKHREAIESLEAVTGTEDLNQIIQLSENPIFDLVLDINRYKADGPQLLFSDVEEIINSLKENPCDNIGIPTPWPIYNAAIGGGLRRGGVSLIGARPKEGKTTLAKESILHFTQKLKIPCLMLDTEMVSRDQVIRSISSLSEVPLSELETGRFVNNYIFTKFIDEAVAKVKNDKYFFYESVSGKPFEEILSTIRRWIVKNVGYDEFGNVNHCVIVYDYFKLMDRSQLQSLKEYEAMGYQISRLTDFCKEFDFPCLAFVQLNRQHDISQSDRLRWLCNSYSTFERKNANEQMNDGQENGNRKLTVMDTRFGPGINEDDYICLNFNRDISKITEIGLKSKLTSSKSDNFEIGNNEE